MCNDFGEILCYLVSALLCKGVVSILRGQISRKSNIYTVGPTSLLTGRKLAEVEPASDLGSVSTSVSRVTLLLIFGRFIVGLRSIGNSDQVR